MADVADVADVADGSNGAAAARPRGPGRPGREGTGQHAAGPSRARGKAGGPPLLRLDWVVAEYERDLLRRDLSPHTVRDYGKVLGLALRCWEELLGRAPTLDDFTVRNAEAFVDALRSRGKRHRWDGAAEGSAQGEVEAAGVSKHRPLSPETVRTYVRALKAFAGWLAAPKQRYTAENRLHLLPMPRKPRTYKLPLDKQEMQALIDACDPTTLLGSRDLALLLLLLDGGLRAGELLALDVGDVNLDDGQVFVASGKGRKSRLVTVGADTRRILARYAFFRDAAEARPAPHEAPFFLNLHGERMQYESLRKWLARLKERAGVPRVFPHLLRHTSAVRTLEVPGSDLFTLQAKLGHADIATTRRYLNMTSEQLSERQRTFSPIDHLGLDGLDAPHPAAQDRRASLPSPARGAAPAAETATRAAAEGRVSDAEAALAPPSADRDGSGSAPRGREPNSGHEEA